MNSGQPILGVKKNPTSRPLLLYRKDNQFYSDINQNIWRDVAHWTLARKRSVCASVIICWDILVWSILKNNIWFEEWKLWRKCCSGQYYWGKKVCVFFGQSLLERFTRRFALAMWVWGIREQCNCKGWSTHWLLTRHINCFCIWRCEQIG